VKGWTPAGTPVELTPRQETLVRALLSRRPATLPARGYGSGWSTVLATAARYDKARRSGRPLKGEPELDDPQQRAPSEVLSEMGAVTTGTVQEWYEQSLALSSGHRTAQTP
jgi:hypothetical protein